jgi:MFS family permease
MFIGLILGGVLAAVDWRLVFIVSVPIGIIGTIWSYLSLKEIGIRTPAKIDWLGNVTFAIGLIALLTGITYGLQPYGGHSMGWTSPFVLTSMLGGVALLVAFCIIETRVPAPMFDLHLMRIRAFAAGISATLLASIARGGLQFMLIIWLQGIWLPLHGYSYDQTPLWAGIYLVPMTVAVLLSAPAAGLLSDRIGAKAFTVGGPLLSAATFLILIFLPVNFSYWAFALLIGLNGFGAGLFSAPNRAEMMNAVPADARGAASGMIATFMNAASVLSIGVFFSLMVSGLSASLPHTLLSGLTAQGVPAKSAAQIAGLPPIGVLFASFLGYNPMQQLLGPVLAHMPASHAAYLTGRQFFPDLISGPFHNGLGVAFGFALAVCVLGAVFSALTGKPAPVTDERESLGSELAAAEPAMVGEPSELVVPDMVPGGDAPPSK